ncbi:DinB family protein [Mucilaginibacter ginsenosidivorans]|uniref:DinB family protein n=1 Tax=Mucilaginibacter ginsenosidivorans TaxID=398053 RepID=A0A5B8UX51_9SPHI|nr:DinB family protein [Mucilaginibacter ginsenosidivorans]QEC63737.1 DinB family protein [Mucilaginibacter ginsenosidivorans]
METEKKPEVWLRGPVEGIPPLLQPVAHTLLQSREEVNAMMMDFPEVFLWIKPSGMACPAFHLQHLAGVLDRLFTYARGEALTDEQRGDLIAEGKEAANNLDMEGLINRFNTQVDKALAQLAGTDENTLTDVRGVGRMQIPSTVIGLLTHAAEHTMRHTGQLLVTVRVLQN